MKVKHFIETYDHYFNKNLMEFEDSGDKLEDLINDFIADKTVIDIKYSGNTSYAMNSQQYGTEENYSALVMYEEDSSSEPFVRFPD